MPGEAAAVRRSRSAAAGLIPQIEAAFGKPVISSNYIMARHALRLAGEKDREPRPGRLSSL